MENTHIPQQQEGAENNIVELVELPDTDLAKRRFSLACKRLLHVSNWSIFAKGPSSEFSLTDNLGNELQQAARVDDRIKIDLPGPGTLIGGGNDWVRIEQIATEQNVDLDEELLTMTVRPCDNPLIEDDGTAHFFDERSTNTFMVMRKKNALIAGVYTRNGLPNSEGSMLDNLRNKVVAWSDMAGSSYPQWKNLVKGLTHICTDFFAEPVQTLTFNVQDDGTFPNSQLPAVAYQGVLDLAGDDNPEIVEHIFSDNGWTNSWRNGIFDVHHYHSITHEVLGVYSGSCKVLLGGDKGEMVQLERGDVLIIPAGMAHKNMGQSADFKCIGAYPEGNDYDMNYGKAEERPETDRHIAAVTMPRTDPVYGGEGLLFKYWK